MVWITKRAEIFRGFFIRKSMHKIMNNYASAFLFKFLNFFFIEVIEVNASLEVIEVIDICLADAFLAAEYCRKLRLLR